MRAKTIKWDEYFLGYNTIYGSVDGASASLTFEISIRGKRKPKYILLTHPIESKFLTRHGLSCSKKVSEYYTIDEAKEEAQEIVNKIVNSFTE